MAHPTCIYEGCSKAPSFGFPGGSRMACSGHKRPGMQYLKHGEGAEDVASKMHVPRGLDYAPSVQRDPDLTKRHEAASAVWANKNQCRHVGCTKAPSFGFPDAERVFCSAHKRPGMEYLAGKDEHHRGGAGSALTQAMGHVPKGLDHRPSVGNSRQHHARSASSGGGAGGKHCQEEGCTKAPSYGWEGVPGGMAGDAVMCAQHKRPAMVYLRHPTDTAAAASGAGKPAPSKDHIPRGLEYIPSVTMDSDRVVHSDHPHCVFKGCTKAPSYGLDGQTGRYCFSHKRPGMIFLKRGSKPHTPVEAERKASSASASTQRTPASAAEAAMPDSTATSSTVVPPRDAVAASSTARRSTAPSYRAPWFSGSLQQEAAAAAAAAATDSLPTGPSAGPSDAQHDAEGVGEVVEAELAEARRCVALAHGLLEDPTVGMKYLSNIVKNPDEFKYRTLKLSNRKFYTEVWLNSGMRGVFLALGFRKRNATTVVLDPIAPNTLECVAIVLQDLAANKQGGASSNLAATAKGAADASWNSNRSPMS